MRIAPTHPRLRNFDSERSRVDLLEKGPRPIRTLAFSMYQHAKRGVQNFQKLYIV